MYTPKIQQARLLAQFIHYGQKRSGGEDYFDAHIEPVALAVAEQVKGQDNFEDLVCAAYLHDSEEMSLSPKIIYDLIVEHFSSKTKHLVSILTHHKDIMTYNDYIYYISKEPDALIIKFKDMENNTKDCNNIPHKQYMKYHDACVYLASIGIEIPEILKVRLKL
jgi:(p)ppGpp synthase/HD superfamily hydrolase